MSAKDVIFGNEARVKMLEGVNILANAVKVQKVVTLFSIRPMVLLQSPKTVFQ